MNSHTETTDREKEQALGLPMFSGPADKKKESETEHSDLTNI
jgi:hypothetical protein